MAHQVSRILKINGREITRAMIINSKEGYEGFISGYNSVSAYCKSNNAIVSAEDLLGVLHYFARNRVQRYRNSHSRKISRGERAAMKISLASAQMRQLYSDAKKWKKKTNL